MKRTQTKQNRAIFANRFKGDKKVISYESPKPRERKLLDFSNGVTIPILLSEGQIINPQRIYKKEMKRREKENEKNI
jgi:hypothetical protein